MRSRGRRCAARGAMGNAAEAAEGYSADGRGGAVEAMRGQPFTLGDQRGMEPGYYWIRRSEPDGSPQWEVARFTGHVWYVTGSNFARQPTRDPSASNAWKIGPRVFMPS